MVDASGAESVNNGTVHVVVVTSELAPLTPGGAGAVVARLREQLIETGDRVSVILVADVEGDLPDGVTAVGTAPSFEDRSRFAAEALQQLVGSDRPDLIEIQDFDGLAFHALVHRGDVGVDRIPVQVRFHGPADLMFEAIGVEPPEIAVARSMESSSYRMADRVVVPSTGIGRFAGDRYGLEADRIVLGQPPLPVPRPIDRRPALEPTLLCIGRLGEVKGTHDLVA
ncbi:MAG: glycosyltransferase, partial [Acidimicrobiia bacterium]|nr:glycosyltransferase [Acidimicrobiia bacterium]